MMSLQLVQVGPYRVSPLTRPLDGGRHAASASLRRGRGSMSHDTVLRFHRDFATADQAARFALEQAMAWIGETLSPGQGDDPALHRAAAGLLARTAADWGLAPR